MDKVLYGFPIHQETKKGTLFVENIKFQEIVKDLDSETEKETDFDFPFMKNYVMHTVVNDRMSQHHFSFNLN